MAEDMRSVLATARAGFAAMETEVTAARDRRTLAVVVKRATGTGDIGHTFDLGTKQRLVFIRCHFSGSAGTAPLDISLDSGTAAAYDAKLSKVSRDGTNEDFNF